MSPRVVLGRDHVSRQSPREGEASAGRCRRIWLVGKQSRSRNSNTLNLTSLCWQLVRSAGCLPNHINYPFSLLVRRVRLAPLKGPAHTKSILLEIRKRVAYAAIGPLRVNLLSLHELPSVASLKPLTNVGSTGYAGILKRESSRDNSATAASGSVPGTLENQGRDLES